MRLFCEPFDLAAIARLLRSDEWGKFEGVAYVAMGVRKSWEEGVDQLARLLLEFKGTDDEQLLDKLFDMLADRAYAFADTAAAHQWMLERLGGDAVVKLSFFHRLDTIHKIDRQWETRDRNKRWLKDYLARTEVMRAAAAAWMSAVHSREVVT